MLIHIFPQFGLIHRGRVIVNKCESVATASDHIAMKIGSFLVTRLGGSVAFMLIGLR